MWRVLIAFFLISSVPSSAAQQDERDATLESFFSELSAAVEAGDRQAYTGLFIPDGVMFLPHRPPLHGRTAIGDWFDSFFAASLEAKFDSYVQQSMEIVGDIAMVRSHATGHYLNTKTGEKFPLDQKYLDVVRYEDGQWQMVYHVANSNTLDPGLWDSDWESQ